MTNPKKIKQILLSEIGKMNQHCEDFCKCPGIDFTRDRKITFDTLLHFQISMESGSVNHELLKYFNFDAGTPSLSSFYQQCAKLSDDAFQKLFYTFNTHFKPKSLLKGRYQLLACDGSGFTFTRNPKDTESYYSKRNAFAALYELIDRHTPCSGTIPVFIADRGFHVYNIFAHAIENGTFFVIRATATKMKRLFGGDLPKEEIYCLRWSVMLIFT